MDIFDFQKSVVGTYASFSKSFCQVRAKDLSEYVESVQSSGVYWPDPLIQVNPNFKVDRTVDALAKADAIHPACTSIFCYESNGTKTPLTLFQHQVTALELAQNGQSYVVTTGTGSGKSLTYFVPMVDAILKEKDKPDHRPGTKAVVVYPMNALANSQLEELTKYLGDGTGAPPKVTFKRYTGQETEQERAEIAANPPDILLTNYMMLELLLTRHGENDAKVIENILSNDGRSGLLFFVLDEMHVYRGRQGADMAMLCRRALQKLDLNERAICVGTSATMASDGDQEDKNVVVAGVASKLFGRTITKDQVITETLRPVTLDKSKIGRELKLSKLGSEMTEGNFSAMSFDQLRDSEIAFWVEMNLGLQKEKKKDGSEGAWVRKTPMSLRAASQALATLIPSMDVEPCAQKLKEFLLASSLCQSSEGRALFAFKLHQFVSGPSKLLAPLLPPEKRKDHLRVDGQVSGADGIPLFPTYFCRDCGQDYHPVFKEGHTFIAREIDEMEPAEGDAGETDSFAGFLSMGDPSSPWRIADVEDNAPDDWKKESGFKTERVKFIPEIVHVDPFGRESPSGAQALQIKGKITYCPKCGSYFGSNGSDRNRLTALSGEGRSSATTAIALGVLNWLHHNAPAGGQHERRKLLGFSDNRQDAALQAGQFNDFKRALLIRGALVGSLKAAGGKLKPSGVGQQMFATLGFDKPENFAEYLKDPKKEGKILAEDQQVMRKLLSHRAVSDLHDTGRYNNPSLERLGVVEVSYDGLRDLCKKDEKWKGITENCKVDDEGSRFQIAKTLLDNMRARRCIQSIYLAPSELEKLKEHSYILREDWSLSQQELEKPISMAYAGMLLPEEAAALEAEGTSSIKKTNAKNGGAKKQGKPGKQATTDFAYKNGIVKSSTQSFIGRSLKAKGFPSGSAYAIAFRRLCSLLCEEGFMRREPSKTGNSDQDFYRVDTDRITWILLNHEQQTTKYFADLYLQAAQSLAGGARWLFAVEAREHTAQVDQEERQTREERFRFTAEDRSRLGKKGQEKRLPLLFCSPTMELGVDISSLDVVYMRNTPPTAANYAQRAGRAGRAGQAALAITYCASQSPHDQYFFSRPSQMVSGQVRAPSIDLSNPDLIRSHLQAVWLTFMGVKLESSIGEMVEKPENLDPQYHYPLKAEISSALAPTDSNGAVRTSFKEAKTHAIALARKLQNDPTLGLGGKDAVWLTDDWVSKVLDEAHSKFDAALTRWRELCRAADKQKELCQKIINNPNNTEEKRAEAKSRRRVAETQLDALLNGKSKASDDFYSYRELASQGFLPGYNFPRLPLMAYLPPKEDGEKRRAFLSRPRFLALGEFGPFSLIYHEGRRYRVDRAILSLSGTSKISAENALPTTEACICPGCGYGHFGDQRNADACLNCGHHMELTGKVSKLFKIENVSTKAVERINANEEERSRQGYDIRTTFQFAPLPDGQVNKKSRIYQLIGCPSIEISYGQSATIWRMNNGFKKRDGQRGFLIHPVSGRWLSKDNNVADMSESEKAAEDSEARSDKTKPESIIPYVEDRRNILVLQFPSLSKGSEWVGEFATHNTTGYAVTLQHALKRAMEAYYDLEEGELLSEPLPDKSTRNAILFYESAEGGAGVLTQIASDPSAMKKVAAKALELMHYSLDGTDMESKCEAGCYRCLLSYSNQPDHRSINRKNQHVLAVLRALSLVDGVDTSKTIVAAQVLSREDAVKEGVLSKWLSEAKEHGLAGVQKFQPGMLPCQATPDFVHHSVSGKVSAIYVGRGIDKKEEHQLQDEDVPFFCFVESSTWDDSFKRLSKRGSK